MLIRLCKYLDFGIDFSEFRPGTHVGNGAHFTVVYPNVLLPVFNARFVHDQTVVIKTIFFEPNFSDFSVFGYSGGEESNDITLFVPLINDFPWIWKYLSNRIQITFFIFDVIADGAIDVNEENFGGVFFL